jgi:preprotein translocase subunit SecG
MYVISMEVKLVGALGYIIGALVIIVSLAIIIAVLFQQGRRAGINGAISGGADTFLSKNKARTVDAMLARWTKYIAILFFVLAIVANIIALKG